MGKAWKGDRPPYKKDIKKTCVICGSSFYVGKCHKRAMTCSDKCRHISWNKRNEIKCKKNGKKYRELRNYGGNRETALTRDGYRCTICLSKEQLQVHHIDGLGRNSDIKNNDINNLQTLCNSCHQKLPRFKRFYENYFAIVLFIINNWNMSDRKIAKQTDLTHPTIASIRGYICQSVQELGLTQRKL